MLEAEILLNSVLYRGSTPTHINHLNVSVSFQFLKCTSYHLGLTASAKFFRGLWNHTFRLLQNFKSRHLKVKAEQRSVWIFMQCFILGQQTKFKVFLPKNPNKVKPNSYGG